MSGCPSGEQLALLLEEQLGDAEQALIAGHIEGCPQCQKCLEELTGRTGPELRLAAVSAPVLSGRISSTGPSGRFSAPLLQAVERSRLADRYGPIPRPEVPGFEILEELGRGGMGVVYKARQFPLNRLVALKMIRAGLQALPKDLARFRIEAEAVAQLRHPNILQIHEIGAVGSLPYVSLELLEGGSLESKLAGVPRPGPWSAELAATLARAVHAAHQAGIVHRDLKPSNVLFTTDGIPKIADFGLAKRLEKPDEHTESGQVLGSPSYLSPEQAQGHSRGVGPAADVYGLGVILYQMLTGRPPFRGTTPVETVMQVIHDEPVPPSRLVARVPRDLETICLKCLAKDPMRRYTSAAALADDLDRYLAAEPIWARRTPLWELGLKWVRRKPTTATLLALTVSVLLVSAAAGVWRTYQFRRHLAEHRKSSLAVIEQARRSLDKNEYHDSREILTRLIDKLDEEPALADLGAQAVGLLDQARRGLAEREAREQSAARLSRFRRLRDDASLHDVQYGGLGLSNDPDATRAPARAALALIDEIAADRAKRPADAQEWLTSEQRRELAQGAFELEMILAEAVLRPRHGEDPEKQAKEALSILDRAVKGRSSPSQAYHRGRAACLAKMGDRAGADRENAEALALPPPDPSDRFLLGRERFLLGRDYYKRGELSDAKRQFDSVLQAQPDHFWSLCLAAICDLNAQPPHPHEAKAYLGSCMAQQPNSPWLHLLRGYAWGQIGASSPKAQDAEHAFEAAESDYRTALDLKPGADLRYAILMHRGLVRARAQRFQDASSDLLQAIEIDPSRYHAHNNLANIERQQGRFDAALRRLSDAIALAPEVAPLYRTRALWRLERKERSLALRDIEEALRHEPAGGLTAAKDYSLYGRILYLEARYSEAVDACDAAIRIDPEIAEAHRWRVAALLELKRYDQVLASCDSYLAKGVPSADLYEVRGLARAQRKDFAGAIDDYTQAIALKPDRPALYAHRGWAHLVLAAPQLALRDFDETILRDPKSGDAFVGRGGALVLMGEDRAALADVEKALLLGEPTSRLLYNAARVYVQASVIAASRAGRRGGSTLDVAFEHQDRAIELLARALSRLPDAQRAGFWHDVIRTDEVLRPIRRRPRYLELAMRYASANP